MDVNYVCVKNVCIYECQKHMSKKCIEKSMYLPNPSVTEGCDTRSILKYSWSEFRFFRDLLPLQRQIILPNDFPTSESEMMDSCLFQLQSETQTTLFNLGSLISR